MNKTKIEWADSTWNVFSGCTKISPGCQSCYAGEAAERKRGTMAFPDGFDLTIRSHKLIEPYQLKQPSLVFVNSMSDFFLDSVPDELRDQMIDIMESTPRHEYLVLTKRAEEMLAYTRRRKLPKNFWAGVSIENQQYAYRADLLRQVEAEVRFISAEPLLGPLDLDLTDIHWVIAGGESGKHLHDPVKRERRSLVRKDGKRWVPREDRMQWVRHLRDTCTSAGVAFFMKQWGGPTPKAGGNELDGQTWLEYPRLPVGDRGHQAG